MCFLQVEVTRDGDLVSWAQVLLNPHHLIDSYFMDHCELGHVIKNLHLLKSICYRWAGSSQWHSDLTASTFGWSATTLSSRPSLVTLWPSSLAGIVLVKILYRYDDLLLNRGLVRSSLCLCLDHSEWRCFCKTIFAKHAFNNVLTESRDINFIQIKAAKSISFVSGAPHLAQQTSPWLDSEIWRWYDGQGHSFCDLYQLDMPLGLKCMTQCTV